jgi:Zn-dependent M28 family amino/carboxypeptidase
MSVLIGIVLLLSMMTQNESESLVAALHIPVRKERLQEDVRRLTGVVPARSFENLQALDESAAYIESEFRKLSGGVEVQSFKVGDTAFRNIVISFGPADAPRIIVGAHYDVCGEQAGADDNASGVAGVLELARLLDEQKPVLSRRIDLVAFALEEPPFFRTPYMGSAVHARSLADQDADVETMISLEMIGYFTDRPNSQDFPAFFLRWFYPTEGNFIAVVGKLFDDGICGRFKQSMRRFCSIGVHSINAPAFIPGIDLSDHLNYWKMGFHALMITDTAFFRNPHYHEPTDTIETLDFDRMADVVKGVYGTIVTW